MKPRVRGVSTLVQTPCNLILSLWLIFQETSARQVFTEYLLLSENLFFLPLQTGFGSLILNYLLVKIIMATLFLFFFKCLGLSS